MRSPILGPALTLFVVELRDQGGDLNFFFSFFFSRFDNENHFPFFCPFWLFVVCCLLFGSLVRCRNTRQKAEGSKVAKYVCSRTTIDSESHLKFFFFLPFRLVRKKRLKFFLVFPKKKLKCEWVTFFFCSQCIITGGGFFFFFFFPQVNEWTPPPPPPPPPPCFRNEEKIFSPRENWGNQINGHLYPVSKTSSAARVRQLFRAFRSCRRGGASKHSFQDNRLYPYPFWAALWYNNVM